MYTSSVLEPCAVRVFNISALHPKVGLTSPPSQRGLSQESLRHSHTCKGTKTHVRVRTAPRFLRRVFGTHPPLVSHFVTQWQLPTTPDVGSPSQLHATSENDMLGLLEGWEGLDRKLVKNMDRPIGYVLPEEGSGRWTPGQREVLLEPSVPIS